MCPSATANAATADPLGIVALTRRCIPSQGDCTPAAISFRSAIHPVRGCGSCFSTFGIALPRAGNRPTRGQCIVGRLQRVRSARLRVRELGMPMLSAFVPALMVHVRAIAPSRSS